MTAMLASVADTREAEIVLAGGVDIVDMKDPAAGALGALPVSEVAAIVAAVAGRRATSAVAGAPDMTAAALASAVGEVAAAGVDYVKVGLYGDGGARRGTIRALAEAAATTRIVAVIFADDGPDLADLLPDLAEAGFTGAMLDTRDKAGGRLLARAGIAPLSRLVTTAQEHGLLAGLAGGLEEPDVPRLLVLQPDFLGFRGALCGSDDRTSAIDPLAVERIRRLIPRDPTAGAANVDYRLLAARGYHRGDEAAGQAHDRVFVRDFVLPVRIGAYSHERDAPQNVRFDVTVEVQRGRGEPKGMGQVFSYDLITDAISAIVAEGHFDFVETLAERIGSAILRHPRARRATVKVEKLEMGPGAVGVEIVLDRADPQAHENPVLAIRGEDRGQPRG